MSGTVELFADGLLKGFAPDEAKAFLRKCTEATYKDGTNLFMEQSSATKLYMIVSGGVDLRFEMPQRENADTSIVTLKPGEAVGWSGIVPPYVYRLSGYCRGETVLIETPAARATSSMFGRLDIRGSGFIVPLPFFLPGSCAAGDPLRALSAMPLSYTHL